jgi:hypothetical protein
MFNKEYKIMRSIIYVFALFLSTDAFHRISYLKAFKIIPKQFSSLLSITHKMVNDDNLEGVVTCETESTPTSNESRIEIGLNETIVDPYAEVIKAKEVELNSKIAELENLISFERISLMRLKDKVSESGKSGYFMIQAQVADFLVVLAHSFPVLNLV